MPAGGRPGMSARLALVAVGGNSLILDARHQSVADQWKAAAETCQHIAAMIGAGWTVVVTHGNGPQVGFILRRSELARHELHEVPLDVCGADTQGAIGYAFQQLLGNQLRSRGIARQVVTIVTQTEVAAGDPAFGNPTKPIGSFMDEKTAWQRADQDGWVVVEDAGRGWRRVVPSPVPVRIVELPTIQRLLEQGFVVVAAGGGGIPVVMTSDGSLRGVPAVIDKDLASALLASAIGADLFVITTAVERVALHYGKPGQVWLDCVTLEEARRHLTDGVHFAAGSMAPKIRAVVSFLERGGPEAIITDPPHLERALAGEAGTHFLGGRADARRS
jgi:carbamate kinase